MKPNRSKTYVLIDAEGKSYAQGSAAERVLTDDNFVVHSDDMAPLAYYFPETDAQQLLRYPESKIWRVVNLPDGSAVLRHGRHAKAGDEDMIAWMVEK